MKRKRVMFFADGRVAPVPPPQTNAERQRDFQRAHPGYDRRRKARERAATKREAALLMAQLQAAEAAKAETVEVLRIPIPTTRYALPAPVECLAMAAINELPKLLAANRQRVMQPASHHDSR